MTGAPWSARADGAAAGADGGVLVAARLCGRREWRLAYVAGVAAKTLEPADLADQAKVMNAFIECR
jgi:hypothetical protein